MGLGFRLFNGGEGGCGNDSILKGAMGLKVSKTILPFLSLITDTRVDFEIYGALGSGFSVSVSNSFV